jgi:hypothetical protein
MRLLTIFSVVWLVTLNIHAQAIIWSVNYSEGNNGAPPGGSWQIGFDLVLDPHSFPSPSMNPLTGIFSMSLGTNDSGRTFFANALNQPGFSGFVAGLTDGANDYLRFEDGGGGWRYGSEQLFLGRSAASPDLAGYNITQIGFRVNNFYDYFDVQEDTYFRQWDYSLDFYGVPEPSTWALLTLGAAASLLLRRKTSRRR